MKSNSKKQIGSLMSDGHGMRITNLLISVYDCHFVNEDFTPSLQCGHNMDGFSMINNEYCLPCR